MSGVFKSIRLKLFFRICVVMIIIFLFLIVVNNAVLETYFYYKKTKTVLQIVDEINSFSTEITEKEKIKKLDYICLSNDLDIVILNQNEPKYMSAENFINSFQKLDNITYKVKYNIFNKSNILYSDTGITVRKTTAADSGLNFIIATANLNNEEQIYVRIPISVINESLDISNEFMIIVGIISMLGAGIYSFILVNRFTKPILDLREVTTKMRDLDFSEKYVENPKDDELNDHGVNLSTNKSKKRFTI